MSRKITISGFFIHANATPCANHCRYCQLASSRPRPVSMARYAALVHRFLDWKTAQKSRLEFWPWFGNSYDHSLEILLAKREIERRTGRTSDSILLGGIAHRTPEAMREWLRPRQQAGIKIIVGTFSGYGEQHDYWNNIQGNYRFQRDSLRLATRMGMKTQQRILLLRSTTGGLERLLDELDDFSGPHDERWAIPLFYSGQARRIERERLTEADFAALPQRITDILRSDHNNWRAEYRWARSLINADDSGPESVCLPLRINEESLCWAEKRSCEEIIQTLSERARLAYSQIPTRRELCKRYADLSNDKVYFNAEQMERLWLERYMQAHPGALDLSATRFG